MGTLALGAASAVIAQARQALKTAPIVGNIRTDAGKQSNMYGVTIDNSSRCRRPQRGSQVLRRSETGLWTDVHAIGIDGFPIPIPDRAAHGGTQRQHRIDERDPAFHGDPG